MLHEEIIHEKLQYYQDLDRMSRGKDCIKKNKNPEDPCEFCLYHGFCYKE